MVVHGADGRTSTWPDLRISVCEKMWSGQVAVGWLGILHLHCVVGLECRASIVAELRVCHPTRPRQRWPILSSLAGKETNKQTNYDHHVKQINRQAKGDTFSVACLPWQMTVFSEK